MRALACFGAVLAIAFLLPGVAHAHLVSARFGDFYGGMLHPLTALENALPMLAFGLLAGLQDPKVARWLVLAAPAGLLVGVLSAAALPTLTFVPWVNRGSFVVLGLLVALGTRLTVRDIVVLGAALGFTHGYENGLALPPEIKLYLFAPGVATVGLVGWSLIAASIITVVRGGAWRRIAVRAAGSWIAAIGLMIVVL